MSGEVKDDLKSEVTSSKPRDEEGQFINVPPVKTGRNPLERFILSHTGNYKDQEDILDIRVGNPLGRIVKLLEDIKKQKAFSFTLKGSLGLAGAILVLSVFGLFGGGKLICEKGTQSQIGTIKILDFREIYSKPIPILSYLLELVAPPQKLIKHRMVLIKEDKSTIYIPFVDEVNVAQYSNMRVIATGDYNSCSQELTLNDSSSIETY